MSFIQRDDISSWGRTIREPQRVAQPRFLDEIEKLAGVARNESLLAVGLRRSYGDSCLNGEGATIDMARLNRFIAFDPEKGILRTEAGASFSDILQIIVPQGWFLPVTPGTRFVTLGGAIANDVHGKNHHSAGTFGRHVRALGLRRSEGGLITLTPETEPELFAATIGGLGLTGIIEWAEIQLARIQSAYLEVETLPFENLDAFFNLAGESAETFEHTVAWVDCLAKDERLGRGIFSRAQWTPYGLYDAHRDRSWKRVPADAPQFLLNRRSVGAFNEIYYRLKAARTRPKVTHYGPFFYPLDTIGGWNRLYGRGGMLQYQCVIPRAEERDAIRALLDEVARDGQASFLAVLKTFGDLAGPGLFSFPRAGTTLALDFPHRGATTLALLARLDSIVAAAKGALYPAKDGRMSPDMFRLSFPRWREFKKDPAMNSDFWRRIEA